MGRKRRVEKEEEHDRGKEKGRRRRAGEVSKQAVWRWLNQTIPLLLLFSIV